MYKKASKLKLRFESKFGPLPVDQLWDLKMTDLKLIIKNQATKLEKLEKPGDMTSFLDIDPATPSETKELEVEKLKFEILKDVYITRKDEVKNAAEDAVIDAEIQHLEELKREKREAELKELSAEELEKKIEELRQKKAEKK